MRLLRYGFCPRPGPLLIALAVLGLPLLPLPAQRVVQAAPTPQRGEEALPPADEATDDEAAATADEDEEALPSDPLLQRSPFIPPNFGRNRAEAESRNLREHNSRAQEAPSRLEFRGFYAIGGNYRFYLYDLQKRAGQWVGLNEVGADHLVTSFDLEARRLTVDQNGTLQDMILAKPSATSGPAPRANVSGPPNLPIPKPPPMARPPTPPPSTPPPMPPPNLRRPPNLPNLPGRSESRNEENPRAGQTINRPNTMNPRNDLPSVPSMTDEQRARLREMMNNRRNEIMQQQGGG